MRTLCRWSFGVAALSACVGASLSSSAFAKDMELLTRLLIPAYMAQNFAVLCTDRDSQFLTDLNNTEILVRAFSDHVKEEVTFDLPEPEAGNVRIAAADTALHVARQELRLLSGKNSAVPDDALKAWCDRSARHFILEIMNKHQEKHEEFERLLEAAKR